MLTYEQTGLCTLTVHIMNTGFTVWKFRDNLALSYLCSNPILQSSCSKTIYRYYHLSSAKQKFLCPVPCLFPRHELG